MLTVTNAHISYGSHTVIAGRNLRVEPTSVVAFVGSNGAGKSTFLKGLAGFVPMQFSSFILDGQPCAPSSPIHRRDTFAIMDNFAWMRGLTLWDHYCLLGKHLSQEQIIGAMERFSIDAYADRMPYSLSTGQAQRASLVTMLLRPWKVLFLDEPEQRLDAVSQEILAEVLVEELADRTVVMATHSPMLRDEVATDLVDLDAPASDATDPGQRAESEAGPDPLFSREPHSEGGAVV